MTQERLPNLRDRFLGCLLGLAVADAVAAPFEGMPADVIYYSFGSARKILAKPPVERLCYTDDTQMMIGVAEVLIERGAIDERDLMSAFVRNFDADRGYGAGAARLLKAAAAGEDWKALAGTLYPGGSLGNGAAMRVAPVGMAFRGDPDRVADEAERSARATHVHPIGIDSARILAVAVALAAGGGPIDPSSYYAQLIARARTEEFQHQLGIVSRLGRDDSLAAFGNGIEAHRSVVTSIACFTAHPDSFRDAVGRAIGLGGDVDTLAAMAGALSGARLGIGAVPAHLLHLLEDGPRGRDYLHQLALRLHDRFA